MKKRTLIVLCVVVIVVLIGGVAATLCWLNNRTSADAGAKRVALNEELVFCINVDQLVEKSAVNDILSDANRQLLATVIAAESGKPEGTLYIAELMKNLDNIGLNTAAPMYGYGNMTEESLALNYDLTFVAEVMDATKIDNFVDFLSEDLEVVREGDMRTISLGEGYTVAYNNKRFIIAMGNDNLTEAFSRPDADLSKYEEYDIAFNVKLKPIIDLARRYEEVTIAENTDLMEACNYEWERVWYKEIIAESEKRLANISKVDGMMTEESDVVMGIAFENGRAVAEVVANGVDMGYALERQVSNNYLAYVDNDALAVLNLSVNGKQLADLLSKNISAEYADMFGVSRNEFNLYFGILTDAIKSIDGDVTVVLNDILDVVVAMDVTDNYIISNVAQFGSGILKKRGDNLYGISYGGYSFAIGHTDNTLYATVNSSFEKRENSATESNWIADIDGSYGYLLMDVDNIMDNSLVSSTYNRQLRNMDKDDATLVNNIVEMCDYAYMSLNTPNSLQFVIVLDDKNTNALEQIVKQVMPYVTQRAASEILR